MFSPGLSQQMAAAAAACGSCLQSVRADVSCGEDGAVSLCATSLTLRPPPTSGGAATPYRGPIDEAVDGTTSVEAAFVVDHTSRPGRPSTRLPRSSTT